MPVSDETLTKIASWLYAFDYLDGASEVETTGPKMEMYIPDAKDLVEKCGLRDD